MNKILTREQFIRKAREVHGWKYDYSKVEYVNKQTKICIICPEHGEFWQTPKKHLNGQSCSKCSHRSYKYTNEEFIEQAKKIHGDKYDYSKIEYVNNHTKICIICSEHGEFWQRPNDHLNYHGCKYCSECCLNTKSFIQKAREIHGDKYDYSKVEYVDYNTPVKIICPEHGEFEQKPNSHLQGSGCVSCKESNLEKETEKILLNNKIKFEREKKFTWLGLLRLDFYLPDYNVAIECQGRQHYQPIDFNGKGEEVALENFKKQVKRDKTKQMLCFENNLSLYYVKYDEIVEDKINNILKESIF